MVQTKNGRTKSSLLRVAWISRALSTQITLFYEDTSALLNNSPESNEHPGNLETCAIFLWERDLLPYRLLSLSYLSLLFLFSAIPVQLRRIFRVSYCLSANLDLRRFHDSSRDDPCTVIFASGFIFLPYDGVFGFYWFALGLIGVMELDNVTILVTRERGSRYRID